MKIKNKRGLLSMASLVVLVAAFNVGFAQNKLPAKSTGSKQPPKPSKLNLTLVWEDKGRPTVCVDTTQYILESSKTFKITIPNDNQSHSISIEKKQGVKMDFAGKITVKNDNDSLFVSYDSTGNGVRAELSAEHKQRLIREKRQAAEAEVIRLVKIKNAYLSIDMISVQGGTFQRGNTFEFGDEKPIHTVTVNSFLIGKTEITQAQWESVMGSNPSLGSSLGVFKCMDCPVDLVSWDDVQLFLHKLDSLTGKSYRLPTEAEWEFAARGGNNSQKSTYCGGNDIYEVAWHDKNGNNRSHPVAKLKPNELGLYDMSGNVWEWCSDWYGPYPSGSVTNPTGATSGTEKVMRGGSYTDYAHICLPTLRSKFEPKVRSYNYGFRVVLNQ